MEQRLADRACVSIAFATPLPRMVTDNWSIDVACPRCGLRPSVVLVRTLSGVYCRCEPCNYLWCVEGVTVDSRADDATHPRRRKGDNG